MNESSDQSLSRRERQIMEVIFQKGQASVGEVLEALPDPPSYSAVRALLRILEDKGHVTHQQLKGKYVYTPVQSRGSAAESAIKGLLRTFFDGSASKAVAALLDNADHKLAPDELDRLAQLIDQARKEGK
jgi:BlaI family penicillinase repressor